MTENQSFWAVSASGRRVQIVEMQHWTTYSPLSGPAQRLKGAIEYFTSDGQDVSPNSDGTFTIVLTDEIFRRDS